MAKSLQEKAEEISAELAGTEGWWRSDTEEAVEEAAYALLKIGMPDGDVAEFLSSLISAIRSEYGE